MSSISNKIKDLQKNCASLIDVMDYTSMSAQEIKELLKACDLLRKTKESIEILLVDKYQQQTAAIADMGTSYLAAQTRSAKRVGRPIPASIQTYDEQTDTLMGETAICSELVITLPTLARWRRNWFSKTDIGFPPAVIYVYGSPRWTKRQVEWWLNESNEKVYIKGRQDDI